MRRLALAARAGLTLSGAAAAQVGARVDVRDVAPERFTDAQDRWGSAGRSLRTPLAEMTRVRQELGSRRLGADESLDVTVLDIALAGYERPGFGTPSGLRVVASGEDAVTDLTFMLTANPRFSAGGLYDEHAVLRDWFASRFPEAAGRG